jgi:hypothetical protein
MSIEVAVIICAVLLAVMYAITSAAFTEQR